MGEGHRFFLKDQALAESQVPLGLRVVVVVRLRASLCFLLLLLV
jgi:hypothetical protein